ncbi:unnamed protein product [Closterium sp. NIES-65]|nr:unnamed protein product [Closterium sp. NIES-65]
MVAFSLAFVLFLLVLSALPASAPSPSGSSITAAAAAATTAAVAGADAAAMSARSVAIGALNGRGYPRVLAARRKPSSAQKSPPPPPPSPPTGSGGVDLGNAQKVLKMLQPYFDDPQFMMFAINGGLLTLMGKALNSTEKVTFFVPDPDTIKDLPDDSPLINDPAIATAVVNFHVVRGRQVTYTELTQAATGTMYMTDQHEPLVKDAASFLFNVVLRPSQGPSRATITMPNAYTDESMQVHVLDSLLIPDSVYFAPPTTSPTISSRPNPPPNPPPRPPQPSPSATPTPPSAPSAPPIASPPPPAVAADKQIPAVATATSPLSSSDPNTTVPAPPAQ